MKIYIAALYSNQYRSAGRRSRLNEFEQEVVDNTPDILESYHYVNKQTFVDKMRMDQARVFVDSGAFSAYTLGVTIPIEDYCTYIQVNEDIIRREDGILMASVLDGIGDPLLTYQNQLRMEELGVRALPCFHAGEDTRYLDWYIENYEYITLGGMVGSSTKQLIIWLDRMWNNHILDSAGNPKVKVHGFGITSIPIMERYPWTSCDSSSWIQSASFGSIITPDNGALSVSDKSPSRHDLGQHVTTMTQEEGAYLNDLIESQGFSLEKLAKVYESRATYNIWAFEEIEARINSEYQNEELTIQELF